MARVNIESSALAEGRFNKLAQDYFDGSRVKAIGTLVLFWFDSQERSFVQGTRDEILEFLPYFDHQSNLSLFEALLKFGYIKAVDTDLFEISGNKRHVEKLQSLSEARKLSGIKGNDARWKNKRESSQSIANGIASDRKGSGQFNAVQCSSIQSNSIQTIKKPLFDFERVYERYPKKLGKKKGVDSCKSQISTQEQYDSLLKAVDRYGEHCRKERIEAKFIKHFSSFMTSWTDWVSPDAGKVELPKGKVVEIKYVNNIETSHPPTNSKLVNELLNKFRGKPKEPDGGAA